MTEMNFQISKNETPPHQYFINLQMKKFYLKLFNKIASNTNLIQQHFKGNF